LTPHTAAIMATIINSLFIRFSFTFRNASIPLLLYDHHADLLSIVADACLHSIVTETFSKD